MDRVQTLWSYYQGLAEKSGLTRDKTGEPVQASYSLFPFYQSYPIDALSTRLNPLTQAFLGDEKALDSLDPVGTDGLVPPEAADTTDPEWLKKAIQDCCQGERAPNASQVHAIETALTHPISIIQGPPGTGKTETIKNLLLCLRMFRPEAKIAVVSANGEALRNIKDLLDRSVLMRIFRTPSARIPEWPTIQSWLRCATPAPRITATRLPLHCWTTTPS